MRLVKATLIACSTLAAAAPAATARPHRVVLSPDCNVTVACAVPNGVVATTTAPKGDSRNAFAYAPAATAAPREREGDAPENASPAGVVPALAAKVAQIQSACPAAHVISAVRHTRIRGSRRMSLHATGEAVDMRGNPSCVYAELREWPGGYSTDYGRVQHVHISLSASGREMGLRFVHGGRSLRHRRFAKR